MPYGWLTAQGLQPAFPEILASSCQPTASNIGSNAASRLPKKLLSSVLLSLARRARLRVEVSASVGIASTCSILQRFNAYRSVRARHAAVTVQHNQ
jgi:hypothetical protein